MKGAVPGQPMEVSDDTSAGSRTMVVVRGGGDLGTGVAHALATAGYAVVVLEIGEPRVVRRAAAFAQAVYAGRTTVEGVAAVLTDADPTTLASAALRSRAGERLVPVAIDPDGACLAELAPRVIVDARMAKRNLGTERSRASLVVALGPGFEAGKDADLVVETMRGPTLARVLKSGAALPDTGVPGHVGGFAAERLIRSPAAGAFSSNASIGDMVSEGEVVGEVDGVPVTTSLGGRLRGLIADGLVVREGEKLGDVDPRGCQIDPSRMSDKAAKIGAAVLEALLSRGIRPDNAGADPERD